MPRPDFSFGGNEASTFSPVGPPTCLRCRYALSGADAGSRPSYARATRFLDVCVRAATFLCARYADSSSGRGRWYAVCGTGVWCYGLPASEIVGCSALYGADVALCFMVLMMSCFGRRGLVWC
eukprot:321045-Rhodomonas_salina.3